MERERERERFQVSLNHLRLRTIIKCCDQFDYEHLNEEDRDYVRNKLQPILGNTELLLKRLCKDHGHKPAVDPFSMSEHEPETGHAD